MHSSDDQAELQVVEAAQHTPPALSDAQKVRRGLHPL